MKPIHFLHIGKTGGTALIESFRSVDALHQLPAPIIFHSHDKRLTDVPEGEKVFFFLRDPNSRFVSGFYSRQRKGRPRYNSPWSEEEHAAFTRFSSANFLAEGLSSEDEKTRIAATQAMRAIQHVRDQYSYWLIDLDYLARRAADLFYVGFQEQMDNSAGQLSKMLNVELKLPEDDVLAHRNPSNVDRSLSTQAENNLRVWYNADFKLFEQCKQIAIERGWASVET